MIKVATYNIQFSLHPDQIIENILMIASNGVSVICLQEVVVYNEHSNIIDAVLRKLGSNWQAIYHLGKSRDVLSAGNCILWNTKVLELIKNKNISLPYSKTLSLHEKVFSWLAGGITVPFMRRVVVGYFTYKNKTLRITNLHLDHNGGSENRHNQLKYLIGKLQQDKKIKYDIICGDFNNFDLFNKKEIEVYKNILCDYDDATINIDWSGDLNLIDTTAGLKLLQILIKFFDIHLRKKLDFIWVRNIKFTPSKKMSVKGSDHLPIISSLTI